LEITHQEKSAFPLLKGVIPPRSRPSPDGFFFNDRLKTKSDQSAFFGQVKLIKAILVKVKLAKVGHFGQGKAD
jgi:hypothetical protein